MSLCKSSSFFGINQVARNAMVNGSSWLFLGLVVSLLGACGAGSNEQNSSESTFSSSSSYSSSESSNQSSSTSSENSGQGASLSLSAGAGSNCLLEGVLETDHLGFSGEGYANSDNRVGAELLWHLRTDAAGSYRIQLRYANGSNANRNAVVSVNQLESAGLDFAPTNAWTDWQQVAATINLEYGSNLVSLRSLGDQGLANIDELVIEGANIEANTSAGNCAAARINMPSAASVSTSVSFQALAYEKGLSHINAYDWDFGDGGHAQGQEVQHSYSSPGDYSVRLTVTDLNGDQSETKQVLKVEQAVGPIKVYIAGDSTVSNYVDTASPNDQAGWGQMLPELYSDKVSIDNRAIGGRTSRRFIDEGRLDAIWNAIAPGDYLLVQFGTNDGHRTATYEINGQTIPYYLDPNTDFKTWLKRYIDGAKARQVQIVLVTPPPRNSAYCTGGNGTGGHAQAMRELAAAEGVPLVDLNAASVSYLMNICPAPTPENFFLLRANGTVDGTHFQEHGARVLASMVAAGLADAGLGIAQHQR